MLKAGNSLRAPANYRPATTLERRTSTPDVLLQNRRLGWLLHLAERHGLVPASDTPHAGRAEIAHLLLIDLFPTPELAASYTGDLSDLDIALGLLQGDYCNNAAQLPSGTKVNLIAAKPDRLPDLGLIVPEIVPSSALIDDKHLIINNYP